jgi:hypothetical protein
MDVTTRISEIHSGGRTVQGEAYPSLLEAWKGPVD